MEPDLHTRRHFLRRSVLGAALSWTVPSFVERTFCALHAAAAESTGQIATGKDHPILVVLQLAGGNDGLNTLVPYRDDAYYRARPTLGVPTTQVLPLDDQVGLHPALSPLKTLWETGSLAWVQGVGYPNPNRSHFRSTEIWQTGSDAGQTFMKGWLGCYFDSCCSGEPASVGLALGHQLPQAFTATNPVGVAFEGPEPFRLPKLPGTAEAAFAAANGFAHESEAGASISSLHGPQTSGLSPLEYLQRTALDARVSSTQIGEVLKRAKAEAAYPASRLGHSLSMVARLIAGGMPTRVYYLSHGGFDTHEGQLGPHQRLLGELAHGIAAFCDDLKQKGLFDRVMLMTFSEFGRRVAENASKGTDHGTAAPMLVAGGATRPGLYGCAPNLDRLEAGDLIHTVDFRSVYATILHQWLGTPVDKILGRTFPLLPFA